MVVGCNVPLRFVIESASHQYIINQAVAVYSNKRVEILGIYVFITSAYILGLATV